MLLIWLLLSGSSQKLKAQDETIELGLKQHDESWVCGTEAEKKFIISVSAGEIKYEDEFYAVQVYFAYNPDKLMFINLLDKNTLSEFFEIKGFNVLDSGLYTAYAATMTMNRVTGNKPLMAFELKYLGDCPDSAHINFDDIELDISESFLNKLNYKDKKLIIDIKTKETEKSFVEVNFVQDTLEDFDEDSMSIAEINLNTNNLLGVDSLDIELKFENNEIFKIADIEQIFSSNAKFVIDSVLTQVDDDSTKIRILGRVLDAIEDEEIVQIGFKQLKKEDDTITVDINVVGINDCTCATSFKGDKLFIISQKDTTTPIVTYEIESEDNKINGYYNYKDDEFIISSFDKRIKMVILYDIMGRQIVNIENREMKDRLRISADKYLSGLYLMNIKLLNGNEKNIVLIKN